jgi:N-acetyl-gamma-glutamyl-phosphate reductase
MTAIRVGILGATGYTAAESIRLLLRHPRVEITMATSRQEAGRPLAEVHPEFAGRCDLTVSQFDVGRAGELCDVVFSCLPHGASAATVRTLVEGGLRVIDFSADFRLSSLALYQRWYGAEHPWQERLGSVPYGLPELYAAQIATADLVANPGCYPTAAILPLAPLLRAGLIEPDDLIVDAKSGVSGAGRSPKLGTLYCEVNESIAAYAVGNHRHQPEIADLLERCSGTVPRVLFTPHLTPMDRGILATIYVHPRDATPERVFALWQETYADSPFVHAVEHLPATKHVSGTNHVQMTARRAGERLVLICAIDNLVKGAAGAAVQNLNCMCGFDERLGLDG